MRKGSMFKGTSQELEQIIHDNLFNFASDPYWLDEAKEKLSEQDYINLCEAMVEAIERGYVSPIIGVNYLLDGNISFYIKPAIITDKPHPHNLTELGRKYLRI